MLATLQTQGKLIKTRATKNKDGMIHSTTFEVSGKLCLIACAYAEKNYEKLSLPFLCLNLNHTQAQDLNVMDYQKKCKAGLINQAEIAQTKRKLQCVIASLESASIINPFATLISLPEDLPHPRKTLLLLLNFIETITFFNQYQRGTTADTNTGEIFIKTQAEDIELAFALLKNSLFRRADELSTTARGFYTWLKKYLQEAKTKQFTALDVRKAKRIHPRTLNRYLQELTLFHYIQIAGGNKYRGGYQYKITNLETDSGLNASIEKTLRQTLETIKAETEIQSAKLAETPVLSKSETQSATVGQTTLTNSQPIENQNEESRTTTEQENTHPPTEPAHPPTEQTEQKRKRASTGENEERTFKAFLELETQERGREYLISDITAKTGRSRIAETRHLKTLLRQGRINREWKNQRYYYTLK